MATTSPTAAWMAVVLTVLGWAFGASATESGAAIAGQPSQTPTLLRFEEMNSRFAISQAVKGAANRLERRACQEVLSDFPDETGQSLSATLAASGKTPVDAFRLLWFVDDREAKQCEGGARLAFTQ